MPAVVQIPQFRTLTAGIPLPEVVPEREDSLLGPRFFFVAATAAEDGVEPVGGNGVEQRHGLQRVSRSVRPFPQLSGVNVVLNAHDDELKAEPRDQSVAKVEDLREIVSGVHVHDREGNGRRPEGFQRKVKHHRAVLPAGEEQHGTLKFSSHLPNDVNALGFQEVQVRHDGTARLPAGCGALNRHRLCTVRRTCGYLTTHTHCSPSPTALGSSPSGSTRVSRGWSVISKSGVSLRAITWPRTAYTRSTASATVRPVVSRRSSGFCGSS